MIRCFRCAAASLLVVAVAMPAAAAPPPAPDRTELAQAGQAEARTPPGVPDRQGCARLCENDLSPCDPPVYKQADGRCTGRHN